MDRTHISAGRAHQHAARMVACWLVALALSGCGGSPAVAPTAAAAPTVAAVAPTAAVAAAPMQINRSKGDPNAPVKVIEYSDFQCPFCASFARETMGDLEKTYIETGKVYFEFRDFPLPELHGSAVLAAHTANCAGEQQQYFAMHDRLFKGQVDREWGKNLSNDFATFLGYASELKLDPDALQSCVQSQRYTTLIQDDFRAGLDAGVNSTPSFLVNGKPLIGAQPFSVWQTTIEQALAQAGK